MKSKGEVNELFQRFYRMFQTRYNAHVQVLQSDNVREYMKYELQQYLKDHRIVHQTTFPNTIQ